MNNPTPSLSGLPEGKNILQVERLRKTYMLGRSAIPVLRDVSLAVRAGEVVSIIGASGSGKSTLLHILGALDQPSDGTVKFQGRDLYALSAVQRTVVRSRQIGFVFQFYHLLPELDVLENVMLPALSRNAPSGMRDRAQSLLEAVGLAGRANHLPMELSGGEQQRAALARALMNQPDLVLADEPTGNLDSVTGAQVLEFLFALARGEGRTLILVTHNIAVARLCDRVLELKDGCLQGA
ncbi:MAG: ABC transporter ATP-binding protein [Kiritimatiellia bacterium]|jgi:predicted ABC-type transport system involved in lysophospholipase L1 biosynthesis ATPase subunit